jgi:putative GTP pyrophosphokinase
MSEHDNIEPFLSKYQQMRPSYERLTEEVRHALEAKISKTDVTPVTIIGRAKSIESFTSKIGRKQYGSPLEQTTDLAGVRVVCAYQPELESVGKVIESVFDVLERIDKSHDLGVDRMGYNAKAFVIRLGDKYSGVRYEGITDLKCEIQVRTILQDAWAIINHHLVYKNEANTPDRLRRDVNNVASLLEIAQGIFDNVRDKREAYIEEIQNKKKDHSIFLQQPVDYDTLLAYTKWKFPNLPESEYLTQLVLRDLDHDNFPTLRDVDAAVERAQAAVTAYSKENPGWFKFGTDYVTKSLGFADSGFRAKHGFASKTRVAFEKYKHLVK